MRTVLIVDDDPFIRRLIATTLEDVGSYDLCQASDGEEALRVAAENRPALIFLDIDMPKLDGVSACRELRGIEEAREATIVMLTAASGDEMQRAAREAGADLFLTKPFSPLELLRIVDSLGGAA
ncbi:MAG TPA: response regulator [Thermoleophilaceae bacterium]|nr:response regulator [Thermoleophilaceae bacterium]